MLKLQSHSTIKLMLQRGLPPSEFRKRAWESEPLTKVLPATNLTFALPEPDEDISIVGRNEQDVVIGQCSTMRTVKFWDHVSNIDASQQNKSTQTFVRIHQRAIQDEQNHLQAIDENKDHSFHTAGIAVLPEYRGNGMGLVMRAQQIDICQQYKASTLFCMTTNLFSARIVEKYSFAKLAVYPYKDLAVELSNTDLSKLDDAFSVWCLKI